MVEPSNRPIVAFAPVAVAATVDILGATSIDRAGM